MYSSNRSDQSTNKQSRRFRISIRSTAKNGKSCFKIAKSSKGRLSFTKTFYWRALCPKRIWRTWWASAITMMIRRCGSYPDSDLPTKASSARKIMWLTASQDKGPPHPKLTDSNPSRLETSTLAKRNKFKSKNSRSDPFRSKCSLSLKTDPSRGSRVPWSPWFRSRNPCLPLNLKSRFTRSSSQRRLKSCRNCHSTKPCSEPNLCRQSSRCVPSRRTAWTSRIWLSKWGPNWLAKFRGGKSKSPPHLRTRTWSFK